ncbi:putative zinc finger domain-containing protein [Diplodia seriata]|uniref:Putative zinc finger domain-containing protein n=1 Tax=Diplodia seriata TaxID=420778 RepID=A0A0G2GQD4_9PEZI|nr:putative zinc finger domain-containing protein [Diplodia seriata]
MGGCHMFGQARWPHYEFSECDSAPGDFSLPAPVDVALWTQSVSGTPYTGSDLFSFGQEDLSSMARNFLQFPKDDEASISSSMDDSAYMSQPDTGRRGKNENYHMPQDTRSQIMEPMVGSHIYSPTLSVQSHGTFNGSQPDMSNIMLPATAASDNGDGHFKMSDFTNFNHAQVASPTDFTFRAPMHSQSWASESQSYSAPFVSGSIDAPSTFLHRQSSYPSRTVSQPYFAQYPTYGIDSMISNTQSMPEQRRRPTLQHSDSRSRFEGSDILSPASTVMTSQFPVFNGGSEYGEEPSFMSMAGSENMMESATIQPSAMSNADMDDEEAEQDAARKSSEEAEVKLARTHPLYQAQPQADEMYHCPFEGQANCQHRSTKLKCNYDKYVDSHLKPFRCKNANCINVEFSSTACLLRHEREAHGMHGHGSKPHLCAYPDCERSIPGNGFPRRYNLYDHMKRVHDYTSPATHTEASSPHSQSAKRSTSRKRKATGAMEQPEKRQRTAAQIKQANTARQRDQEKERLRQAWAERMAVLQQRLRTLNEPKDAEGHQQIIEDATALQKIVAQLTEMG